MSLNPAAFDPKGLSDHDLCLALEEMRRRGWAVAAYDVSDVEALISDDVDLAPTDDEIQHGMCAAMHDAINAEWNSANQG